LRKGKRNFNTIDSLPNRVQFAHVFAPASAEAPRAGAGPHGVISHGLTLPVAIDVRGRRIVV